MDAALYTLAGVLLTGVLAIVGQLFVARRAERTAKDQREHDKDERARDREHALTMLRETRSSELEARQEARRADDEAAGTARQQKLAEKNRDSRRKVYQDFLNATAIVDNILEENIAPRLDKPDKIRQKRALDAELIQIQLAIHDDQILQSADRYVTGLKNALDGDFTYNPAMDRHDLTVLIRSDL